MTNQIDYLYLFVERNGTRLAVSALKGGQNLPGGEAKWVFYSSFDTRRMTAGSGIVGLGTTATIVEAVRAYGLFAPVVGKPA